MHCALFRIKVNIIVYYYPICYVFAAEDGFRGGKAFIDSGDNYQIFSSTSNTYDIDIFKAVNNLYNTNLTFVRLLVCDVCESGRSREAIQPELKMFLFLHRWTWTLRVAAH